MCDGILTKFKLIQALIVVLIVCKNEEDPFKIESTRVVATFFPLLVYMVVVVVVFVFNVPPTAKVIWRLGLGLKSHPTDW